MKITRLELKNFKRFDDLTIDLSGLPNPPKLVLLIGANGSGKSSVFDGLEILNRMSKSADGWNPSDSYYKKHPDRPFEVNSWGDFKYVDGEVISFVSSSNRPRLLKPSFYGRTSSRLVPQLTRTYLGDNPVSFENDSDRPRMFINRDDRFENDIEKVTSLILSDVFRGEGSIKDIRESYINPINNSFEKIFGREEGRVLKLISIKPPLEGKVAEIVFKKGYSEITYDLLSSGEKEIFNILLNLLTRCEYFQDTIYFFDEIDLHLNTTLQKSFLKEITENWIPDNCQLWTASHSLGFIEFANEVEDAAIIDFDNLNFDVPQVILPSPKNNFDVFEIAVSKDFLSTVFEGKRIVFAENLNTPIYNGLNVTNTIFFNGRDKADVFHKTKNNPHYHGLVDRDYLSDAERSDLLVRYKNLFILNYYSIENYLFHPNNLEEYYKLQGRSFDKESYIKAIKDERTKVRDRILLGLNGARDSYPFYREQDNQSRLREMRSKASEILKMLDDDNLEIFFKVFPAKDYGTLVSERQNINPTELSKTTWFKDAIEKALQK